jgi:hypothetical protein
MVAAALGILGQTDIPSAAEVMRSVWPKTAKVGYSLGLQTRRTQIIGSVAGPAPRCRDTAGDQDGAA